MLDQEIASAWPVDQQRLNLFERLRIDLPAFGCPRRPASAGSAARTPEPPRTTRPGGSWRAWSSG